MIYGETNVGEAAKLYRDIEELTADVPNPEAREFIKDAEKDPALSPALTTHQLLQAMTTKLGTVRDERLSASEGRPADDDDIEALLADTLDDAEAREKARLQKQDIQTTRESLTAYDALRAQANGSPTKRQRRELSQELKRIFKANWSEAELADDPRRFKQIMDSALCLDDIEDPARDEFIGYLSEKISEHVKATAATTSPDTIAERIRVCAEEGFSQPWLAPALLKPYFKSVEGKPADEIGENYERFVRGIIRTSTDPATCMFGLDIAEFKTNLLPANSLYAFSALAIPMIRLDQPEMMARRSGATKAIYLMGASLDNLDIERLKLRRDEPSFYGHAVEMAEDTDLEGLTNALAHSGGFTQRALFEASAAQAAIGRETYLGRVSAMEALMDMMKDPAAMAGGLIMKAVASLEEGEATFNDNRGQDLLIEWMNEDFPEHIGFIRDVIEGASVAQDELPLYIPDAGTDMKKSAAIANALYDDTIPPELTEMLGVLGDTSELVESSRREGYVIEWVMPKGEVLGPEELDAIDTLIDDEAFAAIKDKLSSVQGLHRRHEVIGFPEYNLIGLVRPENEEDRKQFHPLEKIFSRLKEDKTITQDRAEIDLYIQEAAHRVAMERRRFVSSRGIEYTDVAEGTDNELSILIEKHPGNPRAFVGTLTYEGESACFLIDPSLRIRTGDRKVSSAANMLELNLAVAEMISTFMCQPAVETEEGVIEEGKSSVTKRIAHLHMLPEGQKFSYDMWSACLEAEGEDLEVLSKLQARLKGVDRNFTYYPAIEKDDSELGPIRIKIFQDDQAAS